MELTDTFNLRQMVGAYLQHAAKIKGNRQPRIDEKGYINTWS